MLPQRSCRAQCIARTMHVYTDSQITTHSTPTHLLFLFPQVFSSLSREPLASASLGQVYKGRLRPEVGGAEVAVKVQRPNVFEGAALDIFVMRRAALIFSKLPMVSLAGQLCCGAASASCGAAPALWCHLLVRSTAWGMAAVLHACTCHA